MVELLDQFRMTKFALMSLRLTPCKGFKGHKLGRFVLRVLF